MTDVRVTQEVVEVLYEPPRPTVKVTQEAVEVLYLPPRQTAKVTQLAVEIMYIVQTGPAPVGIPSTESFGSPVVTGNDQDLSPTGISTGASFGTTTITTGATSILPTGIPTFAAFGVASVIGGTSTPQQGTGRVGWGNLKKYTNTGTRLGTGSMNEPPDEFPWK